MPEFEVQDDETVGMFVRSRVKDFERDHPGSSVYVADNRGMWDIRFTYGEREMRRGTAYLSTPEGAGQATRIRWPVGGRGDIDKILFTDMPNAASFESFILAAVKAETEDEEQQRHPQAQQPAPGGEARST